MSDTSIKSCGPINCQLARAKQYINLGQPVSYCLLPTCENNSHLEDSSKSPFELKQLIEYCKPTNCANFWDALSECGPSSVRTSFERSLKRAEKIYIDSGATLLTFPQCTEGRCPKAKRKSVSEVIDITSTKDEFQVKLCGPPDCCGVSSVNFGAACDLQTKDCKDIDSSEPHIRPRNAIFYCVSPSFRRDLDLPPDTTSYQLFARSPLPVDQNNVIKCPSYHCCKKGNREKSREIRAMEEEIDTESLDENVTEEREIAKQFNTFHSLQSDSTVKSAAYRIASKTVHSFLPEPPKPHEVHRINSSQVLKELKQYAKEHSILSMPSIRAMDYSTTPISSSAYDDIMAKDIISSAPGIVYAVTHVLNEDQVFMSVHKDGQKSLKKPPPVNKVEESTKGTTKAVKTGIVKIKNPMTKYYEIKHEEKDISGCCGQKSKMLTNCKNIVNFNCPPTDKDICSPQCPPTEKVICTPQCPSSGIYKEPELIKRETCYPKTCNKLFGIGALKKWKPCCDSKLCPINDPSSSTYNFLLKVRMCCNTRRCQLAARICDIYEPLVNIEPDLSDTGDPQYHYLSTDACTDFEYFEQDYVKVAPEESKVLSLIELDADEGSFHGGSEVTNPETLSKNGSDLSSTSDVTQNQEGALGTTRRVSTVSWSMPRSDPSEGPTRSEEDLISKATEETDKFRQAPQSIKRGSVFGDIVRKSLEEDKPISITVLTPKEPETSKSKVNYADENDSNHNQKCCPSLRKKFSRKKKRIKLDDDEGDKQSWRDSTDHREKRLTNVSSVPDQDIHMNHLLDRV